MTWIVHTGDALAVLRTLSSESVNCCVTSPPYWGLRDYGIEGQVGREESPADFIKSLCCVFDEVWRVLKDDGTLWVNLGDSYYGGGRTTKNGQNTRRYQDKSTMEGRRADGSCAPPVKPRGYDGFRNKDLVGIPWRLAFALQERGWYLRCDIVWSKPNPMPESVKDRPTRSHEMLFLLSKSPSYYFDPDGMREQAKSTDRRKFIAKTDDKQRGHGRRHAGFNGRYAEKIANAGVPTTRNRRSVWTVAPANFKGAHFATFPPKLIEPCILAGCPVDGVVLDPFAGSGTTGMVSLQHNRRFIGIELNPEYAHMARNRIAAADPIGRQERIGGIA